MDVSIRYASRNSDINLDKKIKTVQIKFYNR